MIKILILALIVGIGHMMQTVTGFGSNALIVPIGSQVYPIGQIIVTMVMLSLLQVTWLTARNFRCIQWRILLTQIFPASLIGLPVGMAIYYYLDPSLLKIFLGSFIVVTSTLELVRLFRGNKPARPLPSVAAYSVLAAAGIIHGAFATGGPLIVYYSSRQIEEKGAFRATLAMLWVVLDLILVVTFLIKGRVNVFTLSLAGYMLPGMILGVILGEVLHHRVNELTFKKVVQILLLIAGVSLFI